MYFVRCAIVFLMKIVISQMIYFDHYFENIMLVFVIIGSRLELVVVVAIKREAFFGHFFVLSFFLLRKGFVENL